MTRLVSAILVVAALVFFFGAPALSEEDKNVKGETHDGFFLKADGKTFTMEHKSGKEHKHTLAVKAEVICNGKVCQITDLKEGTYIRVTTAPNDKTIAIRVDADTKKSKKGG
jgi:hypothetical protein